MLKTLPHHLADLRVPNPHWAYFDGPGAPKFRPDARDFRPENAWRLSEASFLAYLSSPSRVGTLLEAEGFPTLQMIEAGGICAFVALGTQCHWLIFRGTLLSERRNVATDLRFRLIDFDVAGRAHQGFVEGLDLVWPRVLALLNKVGGSQPIFVSGHSLGGALAALAAARLGERSVLYSFGAPRIGDAAMSAHFRQLAAHRVVSGHDLVTQVPPGPRYHHAGQAWLYDRGGQLLQGEAAEPGLRERFRRNLAHYPKVIEEGWRQGDALRATARTSALADHAPITYCVRIWNHLWRQGQGRPE